MTTIMFLNTWGGNVPGYFDFMQEATQYVDVFCLSEVHNHAGTQTLHQFPAPTNRVGAIELKQFRLLQDLLNNTHQGHFAESFRGLHDEDVNHDTPYGIAMFIRRTIGAYGVSSALLNKEYGEPWDGKESASRIVQSAFLVLDGKKFLVAHTHGLWTPLGKSDNPQRFMQSKNILEHLASRLREPFSAPARNHLILGGDFNYTSELKALQMLRESILFGSTGAQVLNEHLPDGKDTRTPNYPSTKPHREADFVLTSSGLPATLCIDRSVPSDHAALIVTV